MRAKLAAHLLITIITAGAAWPLKGLAQAPDASQIIKAAIDYWRDSSSYTEAGMKVHRPDWERSMSFRAWTRDADKSLVRFTAPAKDAGSASLSTADETWTYNPRINKVLKIPASMMHQSWMGSDLSYSDLSKDYEVVTEYTHKMLGTEVIEGKKVYEIEAVPKETAAVVWGREVFKIREDNVLLQRSFYDQDMKLVKTLVASDFAPSGGKLFARRVRMSKVEEPDEWTEVTHSEVKFGVALPDSVFTLSNLSNPRQ